MRFLPRPRRHLLAPPPPALGDAGLLEAPRMGDLEPLPPGWVPGPLIRRVLTWSGGEVVCETCGRSWSGPAAEQKAVAHRC